MTTGAGLRRVVVTLYLIAVHLALIYLVGERLVARYVSFPDKPVAAPDPAEKVAVPSPEVVPSVLPVDPTPEPLSRTEADPAAIAGRLIIPVEGVRPEQLVDSFADARTNGRVHDAIDIMAPAGTPVKAAVDGEIVKFFDSEAGGITIYQLNADRRFIYYYAHLQRRADDVKVGDFVKQGKVIGYVGDTGNAGPGNYHLHFSIAQAIDPKRYWEGTYLDPYPYLKSGRVPEAR